MSYVISPYHIATMGVTGRPITIATDGFIVVLGEEPIPPGPTPTEREIIEGGGKPMRPKKRRELKGKRIIATVEVEGKIYKQSVFTKDLTLDLKDVKVNVQVEEGQKPKIQIILPENL